MIVVEEKLNQVFEQIPASLDNAPVYAWGDLLHLNKWISKKPDTYPLIYQISKIESHDTFKKEVSTVFKAVLATQNTNTSLFNSERWALAFRNELNPLASRITEGFNKCGFIDWNGEVKIERFGNYGENDEHFTADIWDAITYEATIKLNNRNCLNHIQWQKI